ncbi:MAG: hypothetical protein ACREQL_04600 [Candidatus Binatia bacterium]
MATLAGAASAADLCATTVGTVTGTVTSMGGGPLAGVRVRVQTCLGAPVTTDAAGTFTLAVPGGASVVTAAADGYYIGCWKGGTSECVGVAAGSSGVAIVLEPLPTDDDPAHVYRDPESCKTCHEEIYAQWSRSTMAFTNRNRWVDNLYNGTDIAMAPGPPANPADPPYFSFVTSHNLDPAHPTRNGECANCHQPEYVGTDPTNTSYNLASGADKHGIACDFCHKIVDVDVSEDGIRRPNLVVGEHGLPAKTTMLRSTSEPRLAFGPYDDVAFDGGLEMRAAYGAVLHSSRLCAACHEDHADPRDTNDDFQERYDGPPSQTTYSEWAASPYAAQGVQCQDCHMPPTGLDHFCNRVPFTRDQSQVRSHEFPGTTPELLRGAVTLRARSTVDGDDLVVRVDLSNSGAGHDVPTGVTIRNLILLVTPTTRDGEVLKQRQPSEGGGPRVPNWGGSGDDPALGEFAGLAGKGYARVLVDENLVENVLFTEAVGEFDNRIHAGETDATTYRFALPKAWAKQDLRVDTQLWYRRAFKPLADQRKWTLPLNGNPHGTRGDGTDYDGGLVIAERHNLLTCRGKLAKLTATGGTDGSLMVTGTLKLPRKTSIDPVREGAQVTLGVEGAETLVVDEALSGLVSDGKTISYAGTAASAVQSLMLTPAGKRGVRVALALTGLSADTRAQKRLALGLESGDVCARRTLRCKTAGTAIRCK